MPTSQLIEISKLSLDLKDFRTTPQPNEEEAIKAMITIRPDWFYALMQSLLDDGYLLTENIIVVKINSSFIVKEGNRRVGIMKILHGQYNKDNFGLPSSLINDISKLDAKWVRENKKVPCSIYEKKDAEKVDKIISLAHGKGEKAGRDKWTSVARARHNRDENKSTEPILDLLEKYLTSGKNLTGQQRDRWAGDYPLTVLDEAIKKILPRIGFNSTSDLSKKYPTLKQRNELETLLRDIGLELLTFPMIRNAQVDFALKYGISPLLTSLNSSSGSTSTSTTSATSSGSTSSSKAYATNDPRNVAALLKKFNPNGSNRQKVVTLRDEIKKLKIKDNPIAFCFLLRSMFEISAKVYCHEHSINALKSDDNEKTLIELLREIVTDLTSNNTNKSMQKILHGALTEIARKDGILSVTSMNQLVHNPSFSVAPPDISTLFGNIYPLLESMN